MNKFDTSTLVTVSCDMCEEIVWNGRLKGVPTSFSAADRDEIYKGSVAKLKVVTFGTGATLHVCEKCLAMLSVRMTFRDAEAEGGER